MQTELSPQPGQLVGGKYRMIRLLGSGAMGAVYEAEHVGTGKRVAIKWLHPHIMENRMAIERLMREAQASARVRHSNVVDVYDVEREGETLFLVMEYLEGEPLSNLLERGGVPFHVMLGLISQAMRGVAEAHRQGIVHRDIKPDNIFLAYQSDRSQPIAKVLDFGISKLEEPGGGLSLTQTGSALGTPLYMSYEQLSGSRDVDARSDVYAFGVILYEALTGMLPYSAENFAELAAKVITTEPPSPRELRPEIPEELDEIIMWAMRKRREERPPNLGALIEALHPFTLPPDGQAAMRDTLSTRATSLPPPPPSMAASPSQSPSKSGSRMQPYASGSSRPPYASGHSSQPGMRASHARSGAHGQSSSPPPVLPVPSVAPAVGPSLRLPTEYDDWDGGARSQRAQREMEHRVSALMSGTMSDYQLPKRSSGGGIWLVFAALLVVGGGAAFYVLNNKAQEAPTANTQQPAPKEQPSWPPPNNPAQAPAASQPAPAAAAAPVAPPPAQVEPTPEAAQPQAAQPQAAQAEAGQEEAMPEEPSQPTAAAAEQAAPAVVAPAASKQQPAATRNAGPRARPQGQPSWRPSGEDFVYTPPVEEPPPPPPPVEKPRTIEVPGTAPNPFADDTTPAQDDENRYRAGRPKEDEF